MDGGNGGNGVFCLVVADHTDFAHGGTHQGYNLPCSSHKRLTEALEPALTGWSDHLDHSTSLAVEQHPIVEVVASVKSPEDGYVLGVNLREDGEVPRREVWDLNELPCLCAQP